jgi:hypothetical protein
MPSLAPVRPWIEVPELVPEISKVAIPAPLPTVTRLPPMLPAPVKKTVPPLIEAEPVIVPLSLVVPAKLYSDPVSVPPLVKVALFLTVLVSDPELMSVPPVTAVLIVNELVPDIVRVLAAN